MGDPGRRLRPGQPDNDPYYFHVFNANKKSITLNLKSPRGLDLVKGMLRHADARRTSPRLIERLSLLRRRPRAQPADHLRAGGASAKCSLEHNLAFDTIAWPAAARSA
jgi:formyl-CoA transferase